MIKIGVITASDRASAGIYEDVSGVAIQETIKAYLRSEHEIVYRCIPDDQNSRVHQAHQQFPFSSHSLEPNTEQNIPVQNEEDNSEDPLKRK